MDELVFKASELKGKKVLLRVDFNVEIDKGNIVSEFRLKRVIPTIKELIMAGAKVILIAHIDDKEGGTLEPIARYLLQDFPKLYFVDDIFSNDTKTRVSSMKDGDVILFENLRKWPGEKENDVTFAKHLAEFADVYINEAFSVSHRKHASIIAITGMLPSFIGPLFYEEIHHLSQCFNPHKPFLAIMGGAKFSTKLPLVEKFLEIADLVFVAGALMNDLFKVKGYFIGDSAVSEENLDSSINKIIHSTKLILPVDVTVTYKGEKSIKSPSAIGIGERIVDVGNKSVKMLRGLIEESNFIVWNGPLGKNDSGFDEGTKELAKIIAKSEAISIVGGGDVVSVIEELNMTDKFTFVSSGGGAMLDFLANESLPGLEAVSNCSHSLKPQKSSFWIRLSNLFKSNQ